MLNAPVRFKSNSVFLIWFLLAFSRASFSGETAPGQSKWEANIKAFEAADKTNPPPAGAIVFVGSSSIVLWKDLAQDFPEFKTIQRGFGGSEIHDVTAFANRIVIPYRPTQVVLYAGDNDIANGKSPEQLLNEFKSFAVTIHADLPQAPITFISIKPSPNRWHLVDKVKKANALVADYVKGNRQLDFIDVFTPMLGQDGKPRPELFLPDNLHLNRKGYDLWVKLIRPHLKLTENAPAK
jgi:lysophospholipase L1-like esterase